MRAAARAYEAAQGNPLPEPVRGLRWTIQPRVAVTVLAVVGLVVAFVVLANSPAPREPVPATSAGQEDPLAIAGLSGTVMVHVAGAVASPGLYELEAGARVADAVEAAGGPAADAELAAVNLAREVVDGEQVLVPRAGELAIGAAGSGLVSLNNATAAQLEELPGIGPVLAERIVKDREVNGPFRSVEDLDRVSGVGPAILANVREHVTV